VKEKSGSVYQTDRQDVLHRHGTSYNLFMLVLTLFSLVVAIGIIIPTVNSDALWWVDFLICMVFVVDFAVSLWRSPNKTEYFIKNGGWLDLLGAIPSVPGLPWTAFVRLARLNRLVKITKHLQGKDRDEVIRETRQNPAETALLTMGITSFMLITVSSLLILRLERGAPEANILTGRDAFWWAMVTITSVGYGDYVPVTFWGRVLAMVLMIFGIGIFAVLTGFVAARVVKLQKGPEDIIAIVREENAAIRDELAALKELLNQRN
jgi:voltage-gated potassium channel